MLSMTEQIAQVTTDELHIAIKQAWQLGYEQAQKDIANEILLTVYGQTVYEEQIISRCVGIADGTAL